MSWNPTGIRCFVVVLCIREAALCKAEGNKEREGDGDSDETADFALRSRRLVSAQAELNIALVVAGESDKYSITYW